MRVQVEPPCLLIATGGCGTLLACLHGLCGTLAGSVHAVQAMGMRSAAAREPTHVVAVSTPTYVVAVSTFIALVAPKACSPAADVRSGRASMLANCYRRV